MSSSNINEQKKSIYDFTMKSIDGEDVSLSKYKGKKMLIVNVASKCGYTKQYKDLQGLHKAYGDKIAVLGFPANNFGKQEPGTNEEIKEFCTSEFDVTFQMFSKISVKGDDMDPLYQWLSTKDANGWNDKAPSWNFCKYLIDEDGKLVQFYKSGVNPMSDELIEAINS